MAYSKKRKGNSKRNYTRRRNNNRYLSKKRRSRKDRSKRRSHNNSNPDKRLERVGVGKWTSMFRFIRSPKKNIDFFKLKVISVDLDEEYLQDKQTYVKWDIYTQGEKKYKPVCQIIMENPKDIFDFAQDQYEFPLFSDNSGIELYYPEIKLLEKRRNSTESFDINMVQICKIDVDSAPNNFFTDIEFTDIIKFLKNNLYWFVFFNLGYKVIWLQKCNKSIVEPIQLDSIKKKMNELFDQAMLNELIDYRKKLGLVTHKKKITGSRRLDIMESSPTYEYFKFNIEVKENAALEQPNNDSEGNVQLYDDSEFPKDRLRVSFQGERISIGIFEKFIIDEYSGKPIDKIETAKSQGLFYGKEPGYKFYGMFELPTSEFSIIDRGQDVFYQLKESSSSKSSLKTRTDASNAHYF